MVKPIRVRFAPSPTGPLHIGGVRTALYNYLFAKKNNGTFILRIEDTDQARYVPGAEQYFIDTLKWCGLEYEEGPGVEGKYAPYRQSERKNIYKDYAARLLDSGHAYLAFDSSQELEAMRERLKTKENPNPQYDSFSRKQMKNSLTLSMEEVKQRLTAGESHVVRAKIPENEEIIFQDLIRGEVQFHSNLLDDKVLFKSDGMPTYHLANVVDDRLMEITHVIRGEEWLPSTPLHVLLYRFFGWEKEMPQFAHLPLILKPDGNGKLSKRDGDRLGFPVFPLDWKDPHTGELSKGFRERGFLPEAFINMLAFLGWNPGGEKEIFSKEELVKEFSIERVGKAGAKFDFEKAKWFNQQHLMKLDMEELMELVKPVLQRNGVTVTDDFIRRFCGLMKERVVFPNDFWQAGSYFFNAPIAYDEKTVSKRWKPESRELFETLVSKFEATEPFQSATLEMKVKELIEDRKIGFGDVLPALRLMLSGVAQGPALFEVMELIGKEEVVSRMETGIAQFEKLRANN